MLELMPHHQNRDIGGFRVFSHGDAGKAHVMAHRMLDQGRHELGHRLLGSWLEQHQGSGSDWTHLQWHMAIFEIAIGDWEGALMRFEREILPVAANSDDALTDAPAMLWHLALSGPAHVSLAWEPVRARAVRHLGRCSDFVELHCLLALAGAGDVDGLDRWLCTKSPKDGTRNGLLVRLGVGLRAFAAGDYELAAPILDAALSRVSELGGSHAQNQLFTRITSLSWQRACAGFE
jgi:hypothetical protein